MEVAAMVTPIMVTGMGMVITVVGGAVIGMGMASDRAGRWTPYGYEWICY
jgi:hypothetical protein